MARGEVLDLVEDVRVPRDHLTWDRGMEMARHAEFCGVSVELQTTFPSSTPGEAYFGVAPSIANQTGVLINVFDGSIEFMVKESGGFSTSDATAYDAASHRHLRIREQGGTVHFDTSSDGLSWTEQAAASTPAFASSVVVNMAAGLWEAVAPPTAVFDDLK